MRIYALLDRYFIYAAYILTFNILFFSHMLKEVRGKVLIMNSFIHITISFYINEGIKSNDLISFEGDAHKKGVIEYFFLHFYSKK